MLRRACWTSLQRGPTRQWRRGRTERVVGSPSMAYVRSPPSSGTRTSPFRILHRALNGLEQSHPCRPFLRRPSKRCRPAYVLRIVRILHMTIWLINYCIPGIRALADDTSDLPAIDSDPDGVHPLIPWTISNKYYTADVHFKLVSYGALAPDAPQNIPAVIYVWERGTVRTSSTACT